jgi:hypothetical protein
VTSKDLLKNETDDKDPLKKGTVCDDKGSN